MPPPYLSFINGAPAVFLFGALTGVSVTYGIFKLLNNQISNAPTTPQNVTSPSNNGPQTIQESTNAISDLLQNTSIEYLLSPPSKPVVVIEYNSITDEYRSSIDFALMLMEENNIVSIPVVCLEKRKYVGMLNVLDIVGYLASKFTSKENEQEVASSLRSVSVSEVLKSNREPFLPLYATSPLTLLLHVMTTLADEVPVMGSESQILNIATRVDVLRFVQDNIDILGPRADCTVRTLLESLRGVSVLETIDADSQVADAIRIMDKSGGSELAIVSATGRLEGNLIPADLRKLSAYNLVRLYEPVSKFVSTNPDSIVWVEPSSTLRRVIAKFVETKTPVIWIVDNSTSFRPVDSITLRSMMKLLLDFTSPSS